jgi:hypothetical protein
MKKFESFGHYLGMQMLNYFGTGAGGVIKSTTEMIINEIDAKIENVKLDGKDFGIFGSINYWDDIYSAINDTNRQLGISGTLSGDMRDSLQGAYETAVAYGISIDELTSSYEAMVRQLGVNRLFTQDDLNRLAEFRAAYGEGFEDIFSTLALYGASIEDVQKITMEAIKEADELGLNASVYLKELSANMNLLDRLSFRNGIQGLGRMVELSQRYKINIQSAAQFAEDNRMLGDVMETSARLQVLGGQFSRLGNPFELGFLARNEPEKLFEKLVDISGAYAMINEQGQAVVSPFGLDMIREMSQITGIQSEQLAQAAKIRAVREQIGNQISSEVLALEDYEKYVDKIAANAFFDEQRGEYAVNVKVGDEIRAVSTLDLNKQQVDSLSAIGKDTPLEDINKQLILSNETLSDTMQRVIDTFKRFIISENLYRLSSDQLRPIAQEIRTGIEDNTLAIGLKGTLDMLDDSIFEQIMMKIPSLESGVDQIGDYMDENGLGKDLKELNDNLKSIIDFVNNPISSMFKDNIIGDYFSSMSKSKSATREAIESRSLTPILEDIKESWRKSIGAEDTKLININNREITKNYNTLLSQMKEKAKEINKSDGKEVKLTFDEFKGNVSITDSKGRQVDDVRMDEIWKEIRPKFEKFFIQKFGDEIENNSKYNSRSSRTTF